jgi:hypothetical protein
MDDIGNLLFETDYLEAFTAGAAVWLLRKRNPNLGSLLNSEHRDYYIQILHRMLHFRREHELEPMNEDIFNAVKPAQETIDKSEYTQALFNRHMNQLTEWELISRRLEKERLRGYRDERRDRFRYRLTDETISFLHWLEERYRSKGDNETEDASELLDFVLARLRELGRTLARFEREKTDGDERVRKSSTSIFLLHNVNEYTERISRLLIDLAATMDGFLLKSYSIEEAHCVILELQKYINGYLRRIYDLRQQILSELEHIQRGDIAERLAECAKIHEAELSKAPRFMRRAGLGESPEKILLRLSGYYRQQGQIDSICSRVNSSAMKVWGKLSAHLRELERKNNRCEDINKRIAELCGLPETAVPVEFFRQFISSAALLGDPSFWDEFTKADPPQPRLVFEKTKKTNRTYLSEKSHGAAPVQSMEETRLEELKKWIEGKFEDRNLNHGAKVSAAKYSGMDDFLKIMGMSKRGILGQGKALRKIKFGMTVEGGTTSVSDERRSLIFREMTIKKVD